MLTRASAVVSVVSVVDGQTRMSHLVTWEAVSRYRWFGRYPAMCDADVLTASLTTEPVDECQECRRRAGQGQR